MFWHLSEEQVENLRQENPDNPYLEQWQDMQQAYARSTSGSDTTESLPAHNFYIVIKMKTKGCSDHLEYDEEHDMLMPKEGYGEFCGVASTKPELDELIAKTNDYMHLVFQAKIQGRTSWRDLLQFMSNHKMLSSFT